MECKVVVGEWTIPFKSEICVEFIIALPVSPGVKKIMSYVTFIHEFICHI